MKETEASSEGAWVWVSGYGSKGMSREELEQEDRSTRSLPFEVAVVKQQQPQPVYVHNIVEDDAEVGAGVIMTGRVGVAPAPVNKTSCEDVNCTKTPSYGFESDRRRRRCCSHKLENMVYLKRRKCAERDCTRLSSYGRSGGGARFCLLHKTTDMVDLVNRRCETVGCNRRPVFASAGQKASLCSDHRRVDMTDVANHLCSAFRCGLKACWGLPGRKSTACFIHRTEKMQKKGSGGIGTSSRSSGSSISIVYSTTSDEVKRRRVSKETGAADVDGSCQPIALVKQAQADDNSNVIGQSNAGAPAEAMDTLSSDSASHPTSEWMLPHGMVRAQDGIAGAVYAPMGQYLMIPPPGQHLHQHFYQHPLPQSSMLPQAAMHQHTGESTSILYEAHSAYADQQFNHGSSYLQHQHTPCYPHFGPTSTAAQPFSFPNYGGWGHTGPMLIDSRFHQQQQYNHQYAALQLQMQQYNMRQMHMQMRAGSTFQPADTVIPCPTSNEHSSSAVSNSTIDKQLHRHADGISRQAQGASLSLSRLPSMAEMLLRASESGSSGESLDGSDSGKMHM